MQNATLLRDATDDQLILELEQRRRRLASRTVPSSLADEPAGRASYGSNYSASGRGFASAQGSPNGSGSPGTSVHGSPGKPEDPTQGHVTSLPVSHSQRGSRAMLSPPREEAKGGAVFSAPPSVTRRGQESTDKSSDDDGEASPAVNGGVHLVKARIKRFESATSGGQSSDAQRGDSGGSMHDADPGSWGPSPARSEGHAALTRGARSSAALAAAAGYEYNGSFSKGTAGARVPPLALPTGNGGAGGGGHHSGHASARGGVSGPGESWQAPGKGEQHKYGFEKLVALGLGHWGNLVARWPKSVVACVMLLHIILATFISIAEFDSDSHTLYVAQHSAIADNRRFSNYMFGMSPSPLIVVMRSKDGSRDVLNKQYMDKLARLNSELYSLTAPVDLSRVVEDEAGDHLLDVNSAPDWTSKASNATGPSLQPPGTVSFQQLCARRYVHMRGQSECIIVSPLQLWLYNEEVLQSDTNVPRTLTAAYEDHTIDMGGRHLHIDGSNTLRGAQALIFSYYMDVDKPAFWDGRAAAWCNTARHKLEAFQEAEGDIHITSWSRHFNEEEASRFVKNDSYLIGVAFAVVLLYVGLSISGWSCDQERARYLLGLCALTCSGLALCSGLGVSAIFRIPITPVSPLICFTLLGVSVDDMIILTDAFDRVEAEDRARGVRAPPGGRAIGGALYDIGGAVTMTTLTTASTFFTGWLCDLPMYSYFCGCAAICVIALYHIQMTLFAALLLIDARRRHALREVNRHHHHHHRLSRSNTVTSARTRDSSPTKRHVTTTSRRRASRASSIDLEHHLEATSRPPPRLADARMGSSFAGAPSTPPTNLANARMGSSFAGAPSTPPTNLANARMGNSFTAPRRLWADDAANGVEGPYALLGASWSGENGAGAQGFTSRGSSRRNSVRAVSPHAARLRPCMRLHPSVLARRLGGTLIRTRTKLVVLGGYFVALGLALVMAPHVRVGLPQRDTIPDGSSIGDFLDDMDTYWAGYVPTSVMVVFRETNVSDVGAVLKVQRTLDDMLNLPFVPRTQVDWVERFGTWCACQRAKQGIMEPLRGALPPPPECSVADFLRDGDVVDDCLGDQDEDDPSPPSGACADNNHGFKRISNGHTCDLAKSHCSKHTMGWKVVRKFCPLTCGLCVPTAEDIAAAKRNEPNPFDPNDKSTWGNETHTPREDELIEASSVAMGGKDLAADVLLPMDGGCEVGANTSCVLPAHRFVLVALVPQVYMDAYEGYTQLEDAIARNDVDAFVYHIKYEFAIQDAEMKSISLRNLLMAMPVIALSTLLFLHPIIAFLSVLAVASIDIILFGLMAATGIPLNVITLLSLLIALGLAIDYSCHFGHAYQHVHGETREAKIRNAMDTVGVSIFNAGLSTLLGTLFISLSRSALFRIFFFFVWGTIALGLICGLIIVPVALATIGPVPRSASVASNSASNGQATGQQRKLGSPNGQGQIQEGSNAPPSEFTWVRLQTEPEETPRETPRVV